MPYVMTAQWTAKPGEEERVEQLLRQVAAASAREPGCLLFWIHRLPAQPGRFFLYEQYVSEAAFQEHAASEHVRRLILEDAVTRLQTRERMPVELL